MKRATILTLTLCLLVTLSACGTKPPQNAPVASPSVTVASKTTTTTAESTTTTENTAKFTEKIEETPKTGRNTTTIGAPTSPTKPDSPHADGKILTAPADRMELLVPTAQVLTAEETAALSEIWQKLVPLGDYQAPATCAFRVHVTCGEEVFDVVLGAYEDGIWNAAVQRGNTLTVYAFSEADYLAMTRLLMRRLPSAVNTTSTTGKSPTLCGPLCEFAFCKITMYESVGDNIFAQEMKKVREVGDPLMVLHTPLNEAKHTIWKRVKSVEDGWVKCRPIYAQKAVVAETTTGERFLLHIPYENSGYVAMMPDFKGDYEAVHKSLKAEDFQLYCVDPSVVESICSAC